MSQIEAPRCPLVDHTELADVSIHLFSDASVHGYSMCAYLRLVHASGAIKC